MNIGKSLKDMRERNGLSQKNVADNLYLDQTMVSKVELGKRVVSEGLAKSSVNSYNDAQYGFEVAREIAQYYITPLIIEGKAVECHRLTLKEMFKHEVAEAIDLFDEISLIKPPKHINQQERTQVSEGIKELLDVQAVTNSFIVRLEQEYDISVRDCMRDRVTKWKSEELIK
ncbi:helix-turn-helix domain-containing protein [Lentibacillus salicampi]|uniref:XRE family transcriptional regulator n=1 Tax=Lentibacillus salicampi TaxID=175306 RepID=A0A4Y9ADX5_9BACI|nr:helix-turn-helix transcriptional regulator [Lentibacillus salicampi]TFJ93150.1 XRE family transcriptional regulator [Lentibacillus salicampi]